MSAYMTGATEQPWSRALVHAPGSRYAVTQYFKADTTKVIPGQPLVVDFSSGAGAGPPGYPSLSDGDWVVAVIPP